MWSENVCLYLAGTSILAGRMVGQEQRREKILHRDIDAGVKITVQLVSNHQKLSLLILGVLYFWSCISSWLYCNQKWGGSGQQPLDIPCISCRIKRPPGRSGVEFTTHASLTEILAIIPLHAGCANASIHTATHTHMHRAAEPTHMFVKLHVETVILNNFFTCFVRHHTCVMVFR